MNDGAEIVSAPQSNHIQLQRVQSADRPSERTHRGIASGITARIKSAMRGDGVNKTGFRNGPLGVKSHVSNSSISGAPRERALIAP